MMVPFFTAPSWDPALAGLLADHLWQSTLFLAIAALLAFVLRRNRAQVRYWLWLAASMKFLVPFAALVSLGRQSAWRPPSPIVESRFVVDVMQPFLLPGDSLAAIAPPLAASTRLVAALPPLALAVWLAGCALMLLIWWGRWRRVASVIRDATILEDGRVAAILRRVHARPLTLASSDTCLEPGVFGILHAVLLWPRSISARLSDEQIEAILVHELAHFRRRDNLTAALHMVVQSLFWFHPLVWWVGARLVHERERACDEEVLRQGSEPRVYAEGILKTCEFYVAFRPPLVCVSSVTGSDLKRRIEQIMSGEPGSALTGWRKLALAAAGVAAIAGPVGVGVLNAPRLRAQIPVAATADGPTFEVASVKRNRAGATGPSGTRFLPGGQYIATNVTLSGLMSSAYGAPLQGLLRDQIVGGPSWIDSDGFDILAKAEGDLPRGPDSPLPPMIRSLLAERFKLAVHTERRDVPVFALVLARSDARTGSQLEASAIDCAAPRGRGTPPPPPPAPLPGERPRCGIRFLVGNFSAGGVTMAQFANALSRMPAVNRIVQDRTGLDGGFDLDLTWTPEQRGVPGDADPLFPQPLVDPNGPSIFTAVQEQLGLKLESSTGSVDVLVIDRVEQLSEEDDFEAPPMTMPPPPPPPPPPRGDG